MFVKICRLCRNASKYLTGEPFRPTRCLAVDLFPHTKDVEAVILFERGEALQPFLRKEKRLLKILRGKDHRPQQNRKVEPSSSQEQLDDTKVQEEPAK